MTTIATPTPAELVPIDSLKHYKGNARLGNIDEIRKSLRKNKIYKPLVVRRKTREVLAGNHTWEAAKLEGHTEIWVWWMDCDAATARRINMVDNRAPELGGYDTDALIAQLSSISDLDGTGWTQTDKDRLTSALILNVGGDTPPGAIPSEPRTKRATIWRLNEHRLMCGDATNVMDVQRLMDGRTPMCLWTDPPYLGPDDNSSHNETASPQNVGHSVDGLRALLNGAFDLTTKHCVKGSSLYVMHPGGANSVVFVNAIADQKWTLRQSLVWLKESVIMGYHDYHMKHELIAYGFMPGRRENRGWYGNEQQESVLEFDRPKGKLTDLHAQTRPVGLIEKCLVNSTPKGGLVYDPFCGSGSTLIAAENLGRTCVAMEIDPGYCDVIVDRWQRHTGRVAVRDA